MADGVGTHSQSDLAQEFREEAMDPRLEVRDAKEEDRIVIKIKTR